MREMSQGSFWWLFFRGDTVWSANPAAWGIGDALRQSIIPVNFAMASRQILELDQDISVSSFSAKEIRFMQIKHLVKSTNVLSEKQF